MNLTNLMLIIFYFTEVFTIYMYIVQKLLGDTAESKQFLGKGKGKGWYTHRKEQLISNNNNQIMFNTYYMYKWLQVCTVHGTWESDSVMYRTSLSQNPWFTEHHWVRLRDVQNIPESDSVMYRTSLSQTPWCTEYPRVRYQGRQDTKQFLFFQPKPKEARTLRSVEKNGCPTRIMWGY